MNEKKKSFGTLVFFFTFLNDACLLKVKLLVISFFFPFIPTEVDGHVASVAEPQSRVRQVLSPCIWAEWVYFGGFFRECLDKSLWAA